MSIKKRRMDVGLTQKKLADLIGTSRSAIAMWEAGRSKPLSGTLPKLADVLGCTVDELLRN